MPQNAGDMLSRPLRDAARRYRLRHPAQVVAAAFASPSWSGRAC
jgi:hypothetical protein